MENNHERKFDKPIHVLVVEDNAVDQKLLGSMLKDALNQNSTVQFSDTLASCFKCLEKDDCDVVLLDLNLPDSRGEETVKKLHERFPHVAIIVNTGAYEAELGIATLTLGAQDFLEKGQYKAYGLRKVLYYGIKRKYLEAELKEAYAKLHDAQAQLIQAEKMKVVGGLASGVAHEVKNPLATILYGITYLDEQVKVDDKNFYEVIKNIREATNRANDIITDLLDFSSVTKLNIEKGNLNSLIEKTLVMINYEFERNQIKVIKELADDLPEIKIDPNRIQQVIINLMLNAVRAMPETGQIIVKTYTKELSEDFAGVLQLKSKGFEVGDGMVVFEVHDTGCGVPEANLDQVFDPFFTTRRAKGGIGLGLSVSSNIMDNHEGGIFLRNRDEGGACASLVFKESA